VSTGDQNPQLQLDALGSAGCARVFQDVESGGVEDRPGLLQALEHLRQGDALVVWRLDRASRSISHLIALAKEVRGRGAHLVSLTEAIDTQTPGGELIFHVLAALAQFERSLIRERTRAGLDAARARGRIGGRPRLLSQSQVDLARTLHERKSHSVAEICAALGGISRQTLYKSLSRVKT